MKSILIEKPIRKLSTELLTIPDRIEYIRCILGYPVNVFGRVLGLAKGTYENTILNEDKWFRLPTFDKMAEILGVNKNWILTGIGSAYPKNGYKDFIYKEVKKRRISKNNDIGNRLREIREEEGFKAAQFAARIDLSPDALYKIENGKQLMQIPTINNLVKEFGIREPWLLRGEGKKKGAY